MEVPPKKFFRLTPGNEVRLKSAYIIQCTGFKKNPDGSIAEVYCTYDADTKSGMESSNRKVKGTLHWVSAKHAVKAEVHLYDRLFTAENPDDVEEGRDFKEFLNHNSLKVVDSFIEPGIQTAKPGDKFQFQRQGYFCVDPDSTPEKLVFNRTVTLKDTWSKLSGREG